MSVNAKPARTAAFRWFLLDTTSIFMESLIFIKYERHQDLAGSAGDVPRQTSHLNPQTHTHTQFSTYTVFKCAEAQTLKDIESVLKCPKALNKLNIFLMIDNNR